MLRLLFIGYLLLCISGAASANDRPPPQALAAMSEAELAQGIAVALEPRDPENGLLEARDPASAYLLARAWQQRAPLEVRPTIALAQAYLGLEAPAAALELASRALLWAPGISETRDLYLVKVHAHAELNDHLAAYVSAREALKLGNATEDPTTASLVALQWASYATVLSERAIAAFEQRAAIDRIQRRQHFTAERLLNAQQALHLAYQRRLEAAGNSSDRELVIREMLRYLALNEHYGMWYHPGGVAAPLYEYPEMRAELEPYLREAALPVYGRWVRRSLSGDHSAEAPGLAASGTQLAGEIEQFLRMMEQDWSPQARVLETGIQQADTARTVEEIEVAWDSLERTMTGPVHTILAQIDRLAARLKNAEPEAVSDDLRAQFANWQNLRESPLVAAAHLRALHPASGNSVLTTEALREKLQTIGSQERPESAKKPEAMTADEMVRELKDRGMWFDGQITEQEADLSLFRRWAHAVLAEEEQKLAVLQRSLLEAPDATLPDFDILIDQGLMTPALWQARLRVAEADRDWPEQVWSAHYAYAEDSVGLNRWFAPQVEAHRRKLDTAAAQLAAEDPAEQLAALESALDGLAREPGHLRARVALFRSLLQAGMDEAAYEQLVQIWQLHPSTFQFDNEMLSLVLRLSEWPFLLEIADTRAELDDNDLEAHFYRQLAATALGLNHLAYDSVTALNGSHFHSRTRLLHWMEPRFLQRRSLMVQFDDETIGLSDTFNLLGSADEDPAARIWIGLLYALNEAEFTQEWSTARWGDFWDTLQAGASPATQRHLSFLRGELGVAGYLNAGDSPPDAVTVARFVVHYMEAARDASVNNLRALAKVSRDPSLPVLLRAAGGGLVHSQDNITPLPRRYSSRYHLSPRTEDWSTVWDLPAPGQQVVVASVPDLTTVPSDRPLRLEGLSGTLSTSAIVLSPSSKEVGPLWELRSIHIVGPDDPTEPKVWSVDARSMLVVEDAFIQGQRVNTNTGRRQTGDPALRGNLWIESVEWRDAVLSGATVWLDDVFLADTHLHIGRRLEAARVHMPKMKLSLGGIRNRWGSTHAHARFHDSVLRADADWNDPRHLHDQEILTIVPGSTIRLENSTLIDFWSGHTTYGREAGFLNLTDGAISAMGSRYVTQRKDALQLPEGWEMLLVKQEVTTQTVSTIEELREALAYAGPGDTIHLRAGIYSTPRTLRVPAGVSLSGPIVHQSSPAAVIQLQSRNNTANPLVLLEGGLSRFFNIHFQVPEGKIHQATGLRTGDAIRERRAIRAEDGATLLLSGLKFPGWEGTDRAAIEADQSHIILLDPLESGVALSRGGTISLFEGVRSTRTGFGGDGRIFAPFAAESAESAQITVSGDRLRLHYQHPRTRHIRYTGGAAPPRDLVRRENARQHLLTVLQDSATSLQADLASAPDANRRADRLVQYVGTLEHLIQSAQFPPHELAKAFVEHLNPYLNQYTEELPLLLHRMYLENLFIPVETFQAQVVSFSQPTQERIKAYGRVHFAAFRPGEDTAAGRQNLLTMLNAFPPDHAQHLRAMEAAEKGQSVTAFRETLAQEAEMRRRVAEAARQAAKQAVERARMERELYAARLKAQQEDAERRRAELARNAPRAPLGYRGWSSGMGLSPSNYTPYRPSPTRQLQDYSRNLDIQIRNATR